MRTKNLRLLLNWLWVYSKRNKNKGFTLIELLVALIIAFLIISVLLYLVVDLLQADAKESARSETQQEMQMALDYIARELREAVYVYDGNCMKTTAQGSAGNANYCPGLLNYIPTFTNQTPILAFWKAETVTDNDMPNCTGVSTSKQQECQDLQVKRRTYTLVVYLQSTANSSNTWSGKSRITRYALRKYKTLSSFTQSEGYVDPSVENSTTFQTWPVDPKTGTNLQSQSPLSSNSPDVLVDFVDSPTATVTVPACDSTKVPTPKSTSTTASSNSFFACISSVVPTTTTVVTTPSGINQDVVLYLRGNANGKPSVTNDSFRPALQTQVLIRGVINKTPQ
ncbi:prepilin-type N-terminal cleavage/methylation domain-containing protein [Aetokthonos hydrillicola Thurmond2011]|jgi:prepilin-type N-terminal cleavage/methylation domain-containing protein|uniref:Prepilin-type N-terminal cleavage/methylation domain-containing protein n=1 Tax=Aetokthonos hydrillicola Thurmond2011 TaxID=2712845 RepID=A0AAP5I9U6_9CYAN|nr:prepilin-type N-terminal cleavage/methylation domain-containing protein [Aetokthonos hydrillicola]MBO3459788.1 prepilin-type N-terminal cleavage/methylation domain-containing protein [Aetokthonos hydrillicola CCALA 1050]MBW4584567.1 prepilin-type N-terminal cleavage/methylation domain-containing protein [Aetokthonos hydrillicola CCALA 1050]MDR9895110.1 prepilin-type N-terminal cleavage/methylation domain-containing protein [Aetokthonos hydrillicola Thurmond2011]